MLNPTKTEALLSGTRQEITKQDTSHGFSVTHSTIPIADKILVLSVTLNSRLTVDDHIISLVRACNYHLCALRHTRRPINQDLACFIVCSRLDCCTSFLYGITDLKINRLQKVRNLLARGVCASTYMTPITYLRHFLHWLPIRERIAYKIALMTYNINQCFFLII